MRAEKDPRTGKWLIQYRYTDWQGKRRKSMKRGFATKREAEEWLRYFLLNQSADLTMKFRNFVQDMYYPDMEKRLRESTMRNKKYVIELKLMPYFGDRSLNTITAADVRRWQDELMKQGYSQTYLKTINNQLSAIFNYAVRYYDLSMNPCIKAGSMGKSRADEMLYWTEDEFNRFIESVMDKRDSYLAFMILYWTGMRIGELLALTIRDVDFENKTIRINKSLQRLGREEVITPPKTKRSIRTISASDFLLDDIRDYIDSLYEWRPSDRLLPITKYYLEHEMERGCRLSGVKKIRIHDLRHSHASLLINMGFSPKEIADRLGHEKIETTLNTYAHLYPETRTEIAERLNERHRRDDHAGT